MCTHDSPLNQSRPHFRPGRPARALLLLAAFLLVASGCGDSQMTQTKKDKNEPDAGYRDDVETPDPDLFNFSAGLAEKTCEKVFECCNETERRTKLGAQVETVDECINQTTFISFVFGHSQIDDSVKAGRIVVDNAMAKLCLEALAEISCQSFSTTTSVDEFVPGCRDVFVPQLELGVECEVDQECKQGFCVESASPNTPATCQLLPEDGDPCPALSCASGNYCDTFLFDQPTCVAQADIGAACQNDEHCKSGFCASDANNNLTCQTRPAVCQGN